MKITIDEHLKGKELYKFLIENKQGLISQKKSILKKTDPLTANPVYFNLKDGQAKKTAIGAIAPEATSIRVKVIANTALWIDSQKDLLLPDCWKKSIKDRKGLIPHLHDHIHELDAEVGDVDKIYSQEFLLRDLGINKEGTTQCLIFETDIKKAYNEKIFNKYKAGKINQHSIGLQYVNIELAVNDDENEKEYDFWEKYYDQIINKDQADEDGFFWVVSQIKLIENSAVLFGSNSVTYTLEVKTDTDIQPSPDTEDQPSQESTLDINKLLNIFSN